MSNLQNTIGRQLKRAVILLASLTTICQLSNSAATACEYGGAVLDGVSAESPLTEESIPIVVDGIYRKLIPNGTAFAAIACKDVQEHVCYETNPQAGNRTLYIIDPCVENIGILVENQTNRVVTTQYYIDAETGENCVTYWFDPPLEPIE